MYYVFWFVKIVPSLHPWGESHLVMVDDLFNVLLDAVCNILLRILASMFISNIGLKFSFFVMSLSSFEIRMVLALKKEFRSLPSSWIFWSNLWTMGVNSPLLYRILLWNGLVQGFCVLEAFWLLFQFHQMLVVCSGFLLLLHWVLEGYIFLEICPFHLGFQISWHIVLHSNFWQSFVFLRYQL